MEMDRWLSCDSMSDVSIISTSMKTAKAIAYRMSEHAGWAGINDGFADAGDLKQLLWTDEVATDRRSGSKAYNLPALWS